MKIRKADFVCSSARVEQCPESDKLEFAFIGRSNVGKSSLINMITNRNSLAKVSGTPGKTQLINHFDINSEWFLVDLPGYGYARVSHNKKKKFTLIIESYVTLRKNLHILFVLVDSRHKPQNIDVDFMNFLGENDIPFMIVFTKTDKLSNTQLNNNLDVYKEQMLTNWEEMPRYFITSSEKGIGKTELLEFIQDTIDNHKKEK